ncbi:uncharacterized protein GGS25DRAFT_483399 [Hypoxylon fragiforme]|uniref:uncharacterized protein n=1 Tax=Hypoxylon fragiforme TaxID=63214 RepID=UPI0020C62646|nr:uncharacterized protein GGS25DRAFT_483399 [Hypoxylon fragiforme]KAI2611615.1 hypothetical protein GGS25DRAFT_483399 [Hypoxylon fragiforme]
MAAPNQSLADFQRHVTSNPDALHVAFDTYPWTKDRVFLEQLKTALSNAKSNIDRFPEISLQIRVQRFEQSTQLKVDGEAFTQWLSNNNRIPTRFISEQAVMDEVMTVPDPQDRLLAQLLVLLGDELGPIALSHQAASAPDQAGVSIPSWQSSAPTAALYIEKDPSSAEPGKEPYPKKFEEIIEFLQTGKEIPGIRQIPDTVIEDPTITTHGRLAAPPKPWEIGRTPSTVELELPAKQGET